MNRLSSPLNESIRKAIVSVAQALGPRGLSRGTSGNVSARVKTGYIITPSATPYEKLGPKSLVLLALDAVPDPATRPRPSTEWRFHRDIFAARPECNAIVHAHPPFATALACVRRSIPAFHYMVAAAGGNSIRCADYATFGTQELSDNVLRALEGRRGCLMSNHGLIATGATLDAALGLAVEIENLAEQYLRALGLGPPVLLDDAEMARVLEKFKSYG